MLISGCINIVQCLSVTFEGLGRRATAGLPLEVQAGLGGIPPAAGEAVDDDGVYLQLES